MKFPDLFSIVMFFIGLSLMIGISFGGAYFALWVRRNFLIWSPLGLFLYKCGLHAANGTLNDLQKGRRYIVLQDFTDYHDEVFRSGKILTFIKHDYLPYHGGYTLEFEEQTIYLQEVENGEVLQKIWDYLKPVRQ